MIPEFLLPFSCLGMSQLSPSAQHKIMDWTGLKFTKAVEILEYEKSNDGYWDRIKLLCQVMEKALPMAEALYPEYSFVFMFDNATSHSVYAEDALCAVKINKRPGGKQTIL